MCHRMTSVQVFAPAPKRKFRSQPKVEATGSHLALVNPSQKDTPPQDSPSQNPAVEPPLAENPATANPAPKDPEDAGEA